MIYTIIAEPRSGGTALMDWLEQSMPDYKIAQEPYFIQNSRWVEGEDVSKVDWIDEYNNIVIREIYKNERDFTNLINKSDKVICLFRRNWYEQIKSILFNRHKDHYLTTYTEQEVNQLVTDEEIDKYYNDFFIKEKTGLKNLIKRNRFDTIVYEDLYYGNHIDKVKSFFNITSEVPFPINKRHLKDSNGEPIQAKDLKDKII